jgi:hypothetical protein
MQYTVIIEKGPTSFGYILPNHAYQDSELQAF